jgi:hypothetical protein
MIQSATDTYCFNLERSQYMRIRSYAWLCLVGLLVCGFIGVLAGILLWKTYTHTFTPYLKWQDALVSLSWFIPFVALGGSVLIIRFLHALYAGYTEGMVTFIGKDTILVRDLSAENLKSIFWLMNSAFWCFVTALVGLVPAILIGWTLKLANPFLLFSTTGIAIILSIAGVIISIAAASVVVIGFVGGISFGRKLGSSNTYQLNGQATIRIDNFVLTIIYPGNPESMVDLNLLTIDDQRQLLSLLHKRWVAAEQAWNPTLGEEIAQALTGAQKRIAFI